MKTILIYRDAGANAYGIDLLLWALRLEAVDQRYQLAWADRQLLQSTSWQADTHVLIFPGGRDIPYHQKLKGEANDRIRTYIHGGGQYFGICAGSYYASASIEFEKGSPLEVIAERELKFFPGVARGPAYGYGKFCYRTQRGAQIATLKTSSMLSHGQGFAAYYNGGCAFVAPEMHSNVTVLARYADIEGQPAAIVDCKIGQGRALLCGVHPEYSALHPSAQEHYSEEQFKALHLIEQPRAQLFGELLKLLQCASPTT